MIGLKERQYFSDEFKKAVIQEVLSGNITKEGAQRKYRLKGKCAVLNWIRKFEKETHMVISEPFLLSEMKQTKLNPEELLIRLKELEKALECANLKADAYSTMIDIAEKELKINIRKKSVTKQSKK